MYAYLLFYYLRSRLGSRAPLLGGMKITHRCNLRCLHCPFWRKPGTSLSYAQAASAMDTLREWGVRILIIEGGEPFLWQDESFDLRSAINEAKKRFFCVGVTTNGTFPIEVDADVVWVSLDGLRDTHDRIRGESFERAIAHIQASSHPKIYAHLTINTLNWEEIPELVDFLSAIVEGITIQFHYPYPGVGEELGLGSDQRRVVLDRLIEMKKMGYPIANSHACLQALKDNSWRCHPWMIASVEPDGKLTHGCYLKGRGEISCEKCGFSAHAEISLAYDGVFEAIAVGRRVFCRSGSATTGV